MYTTLKSYQIIIGLLKKYGIKHCVLSAGSRNVPFVHSVEEDDYFKCYSVVDERSAGYFALGLAQQLNEPVVISCTSSTATCNYYPAVAEAYYQNVPVIVLTSDRDPAMLGQWEDQMIDQVGMYDRHVKKSVNLPRDINSRDDFIYCQRLVNEALLELNHHGKGPVHINIPMKNYSTDFSAKTLAKVTKIERVDLESSSNIWKEKLQRLKDSERILIACGQNSYVSDELKDSIQAFFRKFNSAISVEYMANIECDGVINTSVCWDSRYITVKKFREFMPDIVISFGGNIMGGIKEVLRSCCGKFEHWLIQEDGRVVDTFKSITTIFECTPEYYFKYFADNAGDTVANDMQYYNEIKTYADGVIYPDFEYSSIYAIKNVVERIPADSVLHLSINNAIRITNFFKLKGNVKVYANIGTHGIDGCLSSFLGQAEAAPDKLCYLIIGDLSFFYDMNAMRIRHIGNNVRILLINNRGGSEFYYNSIWQNEKSDLHTTARHATKAEGWINETGFKYLTAKDKASYDSVIDEFMSETSDSPIFMEVFTEMKTDADKIYDFYALSSPKSKEETKISGKRVIKRIIGDENSKKLKQKIKGFIG